MTHHVVALDNLTLRADDTDHEVLLTYGIFMNQYLEDNREKLAEHCANLIVYGYSELEIA